MSENFPSLKEIASRVAVLHIRHLSDIGHLPASEAQAILEHVSNHIDLARMEQSTMRSSSRDISSITWHIWLKFFQQRWPSALNQYLEVENNISIPKLPPSDEEIDPSPSFWPAGARPAMMRLRGDWRKIFTDKYAAEQDKMAKTSSKLRAGYSEDQKRVAARQIEVIATKKPLGKKKAGTGSSFGGSRSSKGDLLRRNLGIVKKAVPRR